MKRFFEAYFKIEAKKIGWNGEGNFLSFLDKHKGRNDRIWTYAEGVIFWKDIYLFLTGTTSANLESWVTYVQNFIQQENIDEKETIIASSSPENDDFLLAKDFLEFQRN